MFAVIKTGGKQYKVKKGDTLRVERLPEEEGASIEIDEVLLIGDDSDVAVGTPYVEGSKVSATVKGHGRNRKVKVVKFKRRKNYMRTQGHRQAFTELEITDIAKS